MRLFLTVSLCVLGTVMGGARPHTDVQVGIGFDQPGYVYQQGIIYTGPSYPPAVEVQPSWYGPGWYNGLWFGTQVDFDHWHHNHWRGHGGYPRHYHHH